MAWANQHDLLDGFNAAHRRRFYKATQSGEGAGTYHSLWKVAGSPAAGSTPTVFGSGGAIPTKATTGALVFPNPGAGLEQKLLRVSVNAANVGMLAIYDRLWHCSGLDMDGIGAQAIVSPPALTRPDSAGAGTELWGEVYTTGGGVAATFQISYTNQSGTAGRIAIYDHPANALSDGQMVRFMLEGTDSGVRSVQTLTLSGGTGSAGDFGLTILRPIAVIAIAPEDFPLTVDALQLGLGKIDSDACLAFQLLCSVGSTGIIGGEVVIGEN